MSSRQHRRAFATILVLMLLFMMLLMVIAYLRTMRTYAIVHPRQINADVAPVLSQLETDIAGIIGADGKIGSSAAATDIHEPYDYPWTNSGRFLNACRIAYPKYQASLAGMGDPQTDDAWLSPTEPDTSGKWAQVSNIAGSFLVYNNANLTGIGPNTVTHEFVPADAPAGKPIPDGLPAGQQLAGGQSVGYQDLSTSDPRLVDADGDGVGDALWFYPKKSLTNGVRYVAAVRIVDLSSCVNLNTALGEFASAPGTQSGIPRKGEGPYEINASKLAGWMAMPTPSQTYRKTLLAGGSVAAATSWDYWKRAGGAFTDAAGMTTAGSPVGRYGGAGSTAASPKLSDEIQLRDLSDNTCRNATFAPAPRLFAATANGNSGDYGALPAADAAGFALRQRLTTISGRSELEAWPTFLNWNNAPTRATDLNLYQMDATGTKQLPGFNNPSDVGGDWPWLFWSGPTPVFQTFFGGPDNATSADDYPYPEGFKQLIAASSDPSSANKALQYQIQMGISLQDALERDNRPTGGLQWAGWKALPALTEFYGEMPYISTAPYTTPWNSNNPLLKASGGSGKLLAFPGRATASLTQADLANLGVQIAGIDYAKVYFVNGIGTGTVTAQFQAFRSDWGNAVESWLIEFTDDAGGAGIMMRQIWGMAKPSQTSAAVGTIDFSTQSDDPSYRPWQSDFHMPMPQKAADGTWATGFINLVKDRTGAVSSYSPVDCKDGLGAGLGSYAFEIANPYTQPIRLANIRFQFVCQDYKSFDAMGWSCPSSTSQTLDAYVAAADAAPASLMWPASSARPVKDAEGFYVLKPGEKIIFFRNGTENTNAPRNSSTASSVGALDGTLSSPAAAWQRFNGAGPVTVYDATNKVNNVDLMKTLFSGGSLPGGGQVYAINLGTATSGATAAPDLNGHVNNRQMEHIELQVMGKDSGGTPQSGHWLPYSRLSYPCVSSGFTSYDFVGEAGIPAGSSAQPTVPLPGQLVYRQVNARTFGASQKLNLLQARPPVIPTAVVGGWGVVGAPLDMGDEELRTNLHANTGAGATNASPAMTPYPVMSQWSLNGTTVTGCQYTSTTQPLSATYGQYAATLHSLGQDVKTAFPGPNATNPIYATTRQDIKNGSLFFNYMGIPGDVNYPGTFPELAAGIAARDNAAANSVNGKERRDGTPHAMDLGRILMAGPIYYDGSWYNNSYRGGSGFNANPTVNQLTNDYRQNTIGDAINFLLAKDTQSLGLKGLCLRADKPFYDAAKVADARVANQTLDQLYAALATATAANNTADIAVLRAAIRGLMYGNMSWADAIESLFSVDNMKYKGRTGYNADDFKPGTINLNTAPAAVLKCLSLPPSVAPSPDYDVPDAFVAGILQARGDGATQVGPLAPTNANTFVLAARKGLARVSELQNQTPSWFGLSGAAAADQLRDAVSWLPQQASCRSDVFCAYILLQGYRQEDFNAGPVDMRRTVVIFSRNTTGNPATKLAEYTIPNQ